MADASKLAITDRTRVRRMPERGAYDREVINAILDEAFICHAGFVTDAGPVVIPTGYGRVDDKLFIHGSAASGMLRSLQQGIDVCVTVTILDGLVLARSAFHHSMNYRSVVVFGKATLVEDVEEKTTALHAISDHIIRGRWQEVRPPTAQELKATTVLSIPLYEASAKIRTGPPKDDASDYDLPIWAGVLPINSHYGEPLSDPKLEDGISVSDSVRSAKR
ncbi:MAG: flavin-nucleotide-binding protein [Acidobacteriales bacterium]|nr:flavin-nucleotide-binding protein [Terriglobales bacterium]